MKFTFNKNIRTFFTKNGYLLVISAWLFTFSFIIDNYWARTSNIETVKNAIEKNIRTRQRSIEAFLKNNSLLNKLTSRSYNEEDLNKLVNKDYFIFIYNVIPFNQPQLIFWNTQVVIPDKKILENTDGTTFSKQGNGWYVSNKKSIETANGILYEVVSLIPVKWDYYIQNKYLQNSFVAVPDIQNGYAISFHPTGPVVKDIYGNKLFYLAQLHDKPIHADNQFALWLKIIAAILVLFFIHKMATFYFEKKGFWPSFFILFFPVVILRALSYFLPIPLNLEQLPLFSPEIYGSKFIFKSLGDLLINSFLFIWIVLFIRFHYTYDYSLYTISNKFKKYSIVGFISLIMIGFTILCGNIVISLVSDSKISFDVINFFTLNIYSVIGFIVLSCVAAGYFFLIQVFYNPLKQITKNDGFIIYLSIAILGLLLISTSIHSSNVAFNLCLLGWLLLFIFLLNKVSLSANGFNLISANFIFWLFFFSVSITAAIVIQNKNKELEDRKNFAQNLANRADPAGEAMINLVLTNFSNNQLLEIFDQFKNESENIKLKDKLINENFSGYLNKYDTRIYTFDANENALFNKDSTNFNSLNAIIQTQGKPTSQPGLYYYDISYDRFNFISKKEITDTSGNAKGYIFIVSTPKKYKSDALYPELFSKGEINSLDNSSVYSFAIYNNNKLNSSNNDYPFPTSIDPGKFTYNDFQIIKRNGNEELWYRANPDKVIVIVRQDNFFIESITLFAWLFCSFLIVSLIFNILNKLVTVKFKLQNFKSFWQFSIRNQVHGTIIAISIFSFIVIGITTILFFISRYHNNNREKLSRTIHVMENEIRNSIDTMSTGEKPLMSFDSVSDERLEETINRVAGIHAADINLYDLDGRLKVSSLPLPYKRGIVSDQIDPVAFFHLNKLKDVQFSQEQQIGNLEYLSNYVPVRDETGKEYAYLNIPYFESQNNLQDEISNFLVTIINLNAFIFLMAGIIALFITNRITRSFSLISDKMKDINLQKTNEEIVWTRKDEIGELVNEYNKMVKKLDVSAQLLAKSEREGAWREMARQVAHEIKNPLTPMKLNLQYLQMAIDNNSPAVKNISTYVSNILLEQIEHLSQIASDFAQFANIGNTKNQLIDINRVLFHVASLYSTNEKLEINSLLEQKEIIIEADKTQINRLFTNLLQNAIQSVPESRKAVIEIKSVLSEGRVTISVKDNGNGIPREMFTKIFIPNFTTKTSGTGLGLAMCKGIVEKINGKIWFETKEGEWTIFYVELPVKKSYQ